MSFSFSQTVFWTLFLSVDRKLTKRKFERLVFLFGTIHSTKTLSLSLSQTNHDTQTPWVPIKRTQTKLAALRNRQHHHCVKWDVAFLEMNRPTAAVPSVGWSRWRRIDPHLQNQKPPLQLKKTRREKKSQYYRKRSQPRCQNQWLRLLPLRQRRRKRRKRPAINRWCPAWCRETKNDMSKRSREHKFPKDSGEENSPRLKRFSLRSICLPNFVAKLFVKKISMESLIFRFGVWLLKILGC